MWEEHSTYSKESILNENPNSRVYVPKKIPTNTCKTYNFQGQQQQMTKEKWWGCGTPTNTFSLANLWCKNDAKIEKILCVEV